MAEHRADGGRLLTPRQADEVYRLHALGLFQPAEIARMVGAPLERIHRSFRVDDPGQV